MHKFSAQAELIGVLALVAVIGLALIAVSSNYQGIEEPAGEFKLPVGKPVGITDISHKECINNQCVSVQGSGVDQCNTDNDCLQNISGYLTISTLKSNYNINEQVNLTDPPVLEQIMTIDPENTVEGIANILTDRNLMEGWPIEIDNPIHTSPVYGDIDNDGDLEVIVGVSSDSAGKYYAWHHDGTLVQGWPVNTLYPVANSPSIADLDGDGYGEIIGASFGFRQLYVWDHNGIVLEGFPVDISNGWYVNIGGGFLIDVSPTIYDINGDNNLDIIIPSVSSLWVINSDGDNVTGWPRFFNREHRWGSNVAVGDVNNDHSPDIVVAFGYEEEDYPYIAHSYVYIFKSDGEVMDNWPLEFTSKNFYAIYNSPVLADLDGDDDLEIIMASDSHWQLDIPSTLYAWNYDTSEVFEPDIYPNWYYLTGISLADLDNNSIPEILFGAGDNSFQVRNSEGNIVFRKYNVIVRGGATSVVGNIGMTNNLAIIIGGYYGNLYAWYNNGDIIPEFNKTTSDFISTTPALADIDLDGDIELIVTSTDHKVYVWDLNSTYNLSKMEWPMFRHDPWHTGLYGFKIPTRPKSLINNTGNTPINGYLLMKVQKLINNNWQDYQLIYRDNNERTIEPNSYLALDLIWNEYAFLPTSRGNYRAYVALVDENDNVIVTLDGLLEDTSEFNVSWDTPEHEKIT